MSYDPVNFTVSFMIIANIILALHLLFSISYTLYNHTQSRRVYLFSLGSQNAKSALRMVQFSVLKSNKEVICLINEIEMINSLK